MSDTDDRIEERAGSAVHRPHVRVDHHVAGLLETRDFPNPRVEQHQTRTILGTEASESQAERAAERIQPWPLRGSAQVGNQRDVHAPTVRG